MGMYAHGVPAAAASRRDSARCRRLDASSARLPEAIPGSLQRKRIELVPKTNVFGVWSGLSRMGKVFIPILCCGLCVEAAWAYKQVASYLTNPCKSEAPGIFT